MANEKLIIQPKSPKGEDGHRTFSLRLKEDYAVQLDTICEQTGYSRNELIAVFIEFALKHCEVQKTDPT